MCSFNLSKIGFIFAVSSDLEKVMPKPSKICTVYVSVTMLHTLYLHQFSVTVFRHFSIWKLQLNRHLRNHNAADCCDTHGNNKNSKTTWKKHLKMLHKILAWCCCSSIKYFTFTSWFLLISWIFLYKTLCLQWLLSCANVHSVTCHMVCHVDLNVLFQRFWKSKAFHAKVANIRLFTCMSTIMFLQHLSVIKSLLAHCAHVWFLTSVDTMMFFQNLGLCKSFITNLAHIWLLSCVNAIMNCKLTWFGEPFLTHWTFMWSLPSVGMVMPFEHLRFWKSFLTYFAYIWFFPCMYTIVNFQFSLLWKCLFTNITDMWFLPSVYTGMCFQVSWIWESSVAYIANKRFFSSMWSRMHQQITRLCELLTTNFTYIFFVLHAAVFL